MWVNGERGSIRRRLNGCEGEGALSSELSGAVLCFAAVVKGRDDETRSVRADGRRRF